MDNRDAYDHQENQAAPIGPGRTPSGALNSMAQYKFSADEMRVLQECNRESFFQRSLPLSTVLGLGTFAGVQRGYLKPNVRFGAFPKVTLAVVVGYFLGKLSYQKACAEKLMRLPGSYIGQLLRDRRDGKFEGRPTLDRPMPKKERTPEEIFGLGPEDVYSDAGPGEALCLDFDRPIYSDDAYRPDQDSSPPVTSETASQPNYSYEELRRRNRGEFADARQDPYRVQPGAGPRHRAPPEVVPRGTNQYGDNMD